VSPVHDSAADGVDQQHAGTASADVDAKNKRGGVHPTIIEEQASPVE
jgi:hypothetical protein